MMYNLQQTESLNIHLEKLVNIISNNQTNNQLQSRSITSEFNETLTELIQRIPLLNRHQDQSLISDLSSLSRHLVDSIEVDFFPDKTTEKILQLISELIVCQWNHSNHSIDEVIHDLFFNEKQKMIIEGLFRDDDDLFLCGDTLCISSLFLKSRAEDEIREEIQKVLDKRSAPTLQIQGYPPITRESMQEILKSNQISLKNFQLPFIVSGSDFPDGIHLSPMFFFHSPFLLSWMNFSTQANSERNFIPNISYKILNLINQNADNLDSIKLNHCNIAALIQAANYLQMAPLLERCDAFLCEDLSSFESPDLINEISTSLQEIHEVNLPQFKAQCQKKFNPGYWKTSR